MEVPGVNGCVRKGIKNLQILLHHSMFAFLGAYMAYAGKLPKYQNNPNGVNNSKRVMGLVSFSFSLQAGYPSRFFINFVAW